jgi:hypothetical protein
MKRISVITAILLLVVSSLLAQSDWTNKNRALPDKLRELPVGVLMWHDPNPCYPVKINNTYYWKHHTTISATVAGLTVVECGSFIWYNESGWHANMKYSPGEVAEKFNCPAGKLKVGKQYVYLKNWRVGDQAYGGDALWYIIAKDSNGKLYKGTSLIETENKVLTTN